MPKPANYAAMAQYLQSGSSTRSIEFRDGGFFCEGDEVTGRKYIVNFQNLHFGRVTRDENRTAIIREDKSLWDYLKSVNENDVATGGVSDRAGDAGAEQPLILALEDHENGALVHLVLQGPDGRAAIGRLCNLYGRHHGMGDAIVKLNVGNQRRTVGILIKVPELSLVTWEDRFRRAAPVDDDDIPF